MDRAAAGTGQTIGTTGGHVWDAARRMADFLEASQDEIQLRRPGIALRTSALRACISLWGCDERVTTLACPAPSPSTCAELHIQIHTYVYIHVCMRM